MYELKRFLYNLGKYWVEEIVGGISWWWFIFYNGIFREVRLLKVKILILLCIRIYKIVLDIWMCKNYRRVMFFKKFLLYGLGFLILKVIFFINF